MAQITESFESFLARVVRRLIPRLLVINGELPAEDDEGVPPGEDSIAYLLTELRMAMRLRTAVDAQIRFMVVARATSKAESLLDETLGAPLPRPTWKEIGEALGVSAQAAHRKYGEAARAKKHLGKSDTPGVRTGPAVLCLPPYRDSRADTGRCRAPDSAGGDTGLGAAPSLAASRVSQG